MERFVRFNKHVQEKTFTHLISNDAQFIQRNKNIKIICLYAIYIAMNEQGKQHDYTVKYNKMK